MWHGISTPGEILGSQCIWISRVFLVISFPLPCPTLLFHCCYQCCNSSICVPMSKSSGRLPCRKRNALSEKKRMSQQKEEAERWVPIESWKRVLHFLAVLQFGCSPGPSFGESSIAHGCFCSHLLSIATGLAGIVTWTQKGSSCR